MVTDMREKFIRFMQGRYGLDNLSKFLIYVSLPILIIAGYVKSPLVIYISVLLMFLGYFRIFSRNIYKRSYENQKYLCIKSKIKAFFGGNASHNTRNESRYNSYNPGNSYSSCEYKIFKCPNCKQKLRVPRGKGKIKISCRKCGTEFIKRS